MSINRREEILARLFEILQGLAGFTTKVRNRGLLANDVLPAVVLLDGDETIARAAEGRGRSRMSTVIVNMQPQIFIVLKTLKPTNENIGQDLNSLRGEIIRAIADDLQLAALIGPNGDIQYGGAETDLKSGGAVEGEMRLDFTIRTTMNPYA